MHNLSINNKHNFFKPHYTYRYVFAEQWVNMLPAVLESIQCMLASMKHVSFTLKNTLARLCLVQLTKQKTGIGLSKSVLSKKKQDFRRLLFIHQIKIRMLKGLSIGRFQSWQKVRKFKIVNRINGSKYQLSYIKKNYLYSDFVQSLTCRSCKSSVISYNYSSSISMSWVICTRP